MRSPLGSIKAAGPGLWRVRLSTPRDADGKRGELFEQVRGSRRDAELVLARFMLQAGRGASAAKNLTVHEFVAEAWLPTKTNLRARSRSDYERIIKTHIRTHLSDVYLREATSFLLDQRMRRVEAPGARLKVYVVLKQAMRYAVRSGFLESDPMSAVARPQIPRKSAEEQTHDVYSLEEVVTVLEYVRGDRIEAAVLLAVTCGLRRSEICALDWSDLTLPEKGSGEVRIHRGYHGPAGFSEPKSARSTRTVAIPEFATARLRELEGEEGPMLTPQYGDRMNPASLTGRWRALMGARASADGTPLYTPPVRYLPLKNLRHTHATIALAAGTDIVDVSRRLGHSSVVVTDAFYLRPGREADERAAGAFDAAFRRR